MNQNQKRKAIVGLFVSLTAIGGIALREGFEKNAMIPVPGDVPTYGYGSTVKADGSHVELGDSISRLDAQELLVDTANKTYADGIKKCAPDLILTQYEFDFLVDSAYNLGVSRICNSGIITKFRAGDYAGGCEVIRRYKFIGKRDCTIPANKCGGIPKDRERAYNICMRGDYGISSREKAAIAAKRVQESIVSD